MDKLVFKRQMLDGFPIHSLLFDQVTNISVANFFFVSLLTSLAKTILSSRSRENDERISGLLLHFGDLFLNKELDRLILKLLRIAIQLVRLDTYGETKQENLSRFN